MAGRIPETFINDLLARVDIVDVISPRVELKRGGKELKGLSPFTGEKTPSFYVNPAKQMFFDFSSGRNGNAIGFLMDFDNLSFVEAVEELARSVGVEVPRDGGVSGPPAALLEGPLDALAAAARYFQGQMRHSSIAVEYLKQRGVSGETARQFGIGYAPDGWDALLKQFPDPRHAVTAGLLIEKDQGSHYDRFRNRIMFPIRDGRGRTIAFGGRTLGDDPAKYLNSPETPVFHKGRHLYGLYEARQANQDLEFLLLVEGYMDVVSLFGAGVPLAVAAMGTAFTEDQLKLLFRNSRQLVFCFDGDEAGRRAAGKALELVLPHMRGDREVRFLFLPDGQDPDTLVREIGQTAFREQIATAMPLSEFLLRSVSAGLRLDSIDGRARLVEKARPLLASMPPGALRSLIVGRLSEQSGLRADDVEAGQLPERGLPVVTVEQAGPGNQRPVRRALRLLLESPALAEEVDNLGQLQALDAPGVDLLLEVVDYFQAHPEAHAGALIQHFSGREEANWLARLSGKPLEVEAPAAREEFLDILARMRKRANAQRIRELLDGGAELSDAERAELMQLLSEKA